MKKKIFLTLMALAVLATALVGCSWNEVTGISLKGDFDTEFTLYDQLNPADITLEVTFGDKTTAIIQGDANGVTITGFSTDTATASGKMIIRYRGASLEVPYTVVGEASNINTQNGLEVALKGDVPIINLADGTYDMALIGDITRSVIIRATGENVVLRDTTVAIPAGAGVSTVEFRGLTLTNTPIDGTETNALTITSAREVTADAATEALDTVVLEGCTVKGVGKACGIDAKNEANVNLTVNNSQFVTEDLAQDRFEHMIYANASKHVNSLITFTNNVVECNVWYGLSNISNLVMTGNVVDSKLTASTELKDSAMAPLFNLSKNPVWFHIYPSVDNQANYIITNNTFRNFENLFRAYEFDRIENYDAFTFEDNTLYNINYLVNYSGGSRFASKFGEIVKDGSLSLVPGLNGYSNESRDVLEMNTALGKDTTDGDMAERYIGTVAEYYTDLDLEDQIARFTYQVKNTVDAENCYVYIGKSGSHYFAQKQADGTIKYWSGKVSYSADGKDNVTLTEVTRDAVESAFGIA